MTVLPNLLQQRARLSPDVPALIREGEEISFAALERRAAARAAWLAAAGVAAGERVAILMEGSVRYVELVHALMRLPAVLVPLNTRLSVPELRFVLQDAGVRWLVHDEAHPATAAALETPGVRLLPPADGATGGFAAAPPAAVAELEALHCIIYTSGTTGRPKGAMLPYRSHWWNAVGSALNLGLQQDDRWLACMPLFHVGGLSILFRSVIYGIPIVWHDTFDAGRINASIERDRVTLISVVPAMLQRLLDQRAGRPYPAALRCVLLGGGAAPQPLVDRCIRAGVPVSPSYGLTEAASQVATLHPAEVEGRTGSSGKPLFPMRLRICGAEGELPAGEVGDIELAGPSLFDGYLGGERQNGWFRTGDVGYLDDQGYLYVLERRDDLIVSGGENVYPAEVEAVLLSHPAVAEAGVYAQPDERWGQVPAAVVVLRAPAEPEELIAYCRARLAGYKVPVAIRPVEALPRTASGKLLRRRLGQVEERPS